MRESMAYDIMFKVSYGTTKCKSTHIVLYEKTLYNAYFTFLFQKGRMGDYTLASNKIKITYNNTVVRTTIEDMQFEVANGIL